MPCNATNAQYKSTSMAYFLQTTNPPSGALHRRSHFVYQRGKYQRSHMIPPHLSFVDESPSHENSRWISQIPQLLVAQHLLFSPRILLQELSLAGVNVHSIRANDIKSGSRLPVRLA